MIAIPPDETETFRLHIALANRFGDRFDKALSLPVNSLTVTREDGLEVSGFVVSEGMEKRACYTRGDGFFCSCEDNFYRKQMCKHLLALIVKAFAKSKITIEEAMGLVA